MFSKFRNILDARHSPFSGRVPFGCCYALGLASFQLYRFFGRTTDAPSKAIFYKQRKKNKEDAFRNLLLAFNRKLPKKLYNGKYEFWACDGSSCDIFLNPQDKDTYFEPNGKSTRGFNQNPHEKHSAAPLLQNKADKYLSVLPVFRMSRVLQLLRPLALHQCPISHNATLSSLRTFVLSQLYTARIPISIVKHNIFYPFSFNIS